MRNLDEELGDKGGHIVTHGMKEQLCCNQLPKVNFTNGI